MLYAVYLQATVVWKDARKFFYWRLHRLLLEEQAIKLTKAANPSLTDGHVQSMLSRWFTEAKGTVQVGQSAFEDECVMTCKYTPLQ